ncbi:hypothetical protein ACFSQU_01145 [Massilia sp. GCM10020059]|uniref:Uncharacterized protein n=1 Tax=Massilia agrisoli TaxID=2892444 RepID=A0ABS8IR63_9BURK|nr:hypothetical protein [Massilia agrisoli]MCC6070688.1 hypothetical protein [Massilia agrisoli]
MNIAKNMEAIFLTATAIALASVTTFATASTAVKRIDPPAVTQAAADTTMTVVTITGKRLTAAEKAALGD